jgi:hypothetical protein
VANAEEGAEEVAALNGELVEGGVEVVVSDGGGWLVDGDEGGLSEQLADEGGAGAFGFWMRRSRSVRIARREAKQKPTLPSIEEINGGVFSMDQLLRTDSRSPGSAPASRSRTGRNFERSARRTVRDSARGGGGRLPHPVR